MYPTPFELHFSVLHLKWYQTNPQDYVENMKGTDKDLAAHFTIIFHRGETLYGEEILKVFSKVDREYYIDSIQSDIANAKEEILENPVYLILNLCRVLAYKKNNLILSKYEGGEWGISNLPKKYSSLIAEAIKGYQTGQKMLLNNASAEEFAQYMLEKIGL